MAEIVMTNAFVRGFDTGSIATWSTFIKSVTLNLTREDHDKTTMRSSGRKHKYGLRNDSVTFVFNQNFADNGVDEILYGLMGATSGWFSVKPTTAVAAAGNPRYYGHIILGSYGPLSGNVGDLQSPSVTFQANGVIRRSATS